MATWRDFGENLSQLASAVFMEVGCNKREIDYQRVLVRKLKALYGECNVEQEVGISHQYGMSSSLAFGGRQMERRCLDIMVFLDNGDWAVIELKASQQLTAEHEDQLRRYIRSVNMIGYRTAEYGFLINFPTNDTYPEIRYVR